MFYITYRGINATVKSMQAVGTLTEHQVESVLRRAEGLKSGLNWKLVRQSLLKYIDNGEVIVNQIEEDASADTRTSKVMPI